jgi:hypothetical protein
MVANQLDQGTAQALLADICDISEKEKVKLLWNLHQVSLTLQQFDVLAIHCSRGLLDNRTYSSAVCGYSPTHSMSTSTTLLGAVSATDGSSMGCRVPGTCAVTAR